MTAPTIAAVNTRRNAHAERCILCDRTVPAGAGMTVRLAIGGHACVHFACSPLRPKITKGGARAAACRAALGAGR